MGMNLAGHPKRPSEAPWSVSGQSPIYVGASLDWTCCGTFEGFSIQIGVWGTRRPGQSLVDLTFSSSSCAVMLGQISKLNAVCHLWLNSERTEKNTSARGILSLTLMWPFKWFPLNGVKLLINTHPHSCFHTSWVTQASISSASLCFVVKQMTKSFWFGWKAWWGCVPNCILFYVNLLLCG